MSESIQYVSIASLPEWNKVGGTNYDLANSKMELELLSSNGTSQLYSSNSITLKTLVSALYDASLKDLINDKYGLDGTKKPDIGGTCAYVSKLSGLAPIYTDIFNNHSLSFIKKPTYKITDSEFITKKDYNSYSENDKNYVSISKDNMHFYAKYVNLENSKPEYDTEGRIDEAPSTDSDKHNRYIFKITRHTSETYKCEKSGWFTCYGWLSEKETYYAKTIGNEGQGRQDNSKRWVALEGNFSSDTDPKWKILQIQSILPGNLCNYVSFSLPVRKDLQLRVTTGFDVGKNSGQYSSIPGSLANHIPNAFIGGIYA